MREGPPDCQCDRVTSMTMEIFLSAQQPHATPTGRDAHSTRRSLTVKDHPGQGAVRRASKGTFRWRLAIHSVEPRCLPRGRHAGNPARANGQAVRGRPMQQGWQCRWAAVGRPGGACARGVHAIGGCVLRTAVLCAPCMSDSGACAPGCGAVLAKSPRLCSMHSNSNRLPLRSNSKCFTYIGYLLATCTFARLESSNARQCRCDKERVDHGGVTHAILLSDHSECCGHGGHVTSSGERGWARACKSGSQPSRNRNVERLPGCAKWRHGSRSRFIATCCSTKPRNSKAKPGS